MKVFCFLAVLLPLTALVGGQKRQDDYKLRGNSFGLENFLFQTLEDLEISDAVQDVKNVRQTVGYKDNFNGESEKSDETENLNVGYGINGAKSVSHWKSQNQSHQMAESAHAFKEPPRKTSNFSQKSEIATQEKGTERIRGRLVLKRRKRPLNSIQTENRVRVPNQGSNILKSGRIPVYSQAPKLNIRTTTPSKSFRETSGSGYHQRPLNVNSVTSSTTIRPEVTSYKHEIQVKQEREQLMTFDNENLGTTEKSSTINLKAFLKQQTETLSLSELLQTQNLSLADLLRGNKDASTILKLKQTFSTTSASPSLKLNLEHGTEPTAKAFVSKSGYQEGFKELDTYEETTIKGNFKKIQSKFSGLQYRDSLDIEKKENQLRNKENSIETINTTKRANLYASNTANFVPQNRMKLRNYSRRPQVTTRELESSSIKPNELYSTSPDIIVTKITHVPLYKKKRISLKSSAHEQDEDSDNTINWTNKSPLERTEQEREKEVSYLVTPTQIVLNEPTESKKNEKSFEMEFGTSTTKHYEDTKISQEDIKKTESKDELIELLKSKNNADELEKILHTRNMTLEEILYNREKSTVQTNIEELFSNHRIHKEISAQSTVVFKTLPPFNTMNTEQVAPSENIEYEEPYAEESSHMVDHINLVVRREGKKLEIPSSSSNRESVARNEPDDLMADTSNVEGLAAWKLSKKSLAFGSSYDAEDSTRTIERVTDKSITYKTTDIPRTEIIVLDTLESNKGPERKFKLNLRHLTRDEGTSETEDIEKSYIPPAVKSAIIASGVVMGIALFVFIAIFAAYGWRQRQLHLKASSSFFTDGFSKTEASKTTNSLSSPYCKRGEKTKKTNEFDDDSSESGTSFGGSYLWNTLKNTFGRKSLKCRLEKQMRKKEDETMLRRKEIKKNMKSHRGERSNVLQAEDNRTGVNNIDRTRNVIHTSFGFKRSLRKENSNYFNECNSRN